MHEEQIDTKAVSGTTRLANKTATLTLISSFAFLVGIIAAPAALRDGEDALTRVAAASPLSAAIGTAAWAVRSRVQLRLAREREATPWAESSGAPPTHPTR